MLHRLLVTALLVSAPLAASATTLVDGGFEAKGSATPVNDYCYDGFATPGGPACAASPWVGGGVIITGSGPWGSTAAAEGSYYGFVQGLSVVSQTFVATATSGLAVNWLDSNRTNNGGGLQTYSVTVTNGANVVDLGTFSGVGGVFTAKSSSAFAVVAGETYTLSFNGLSNQDRTAFIDGVSLAVVPEPATWGLMIAGFGLVGLAARRRRTSVAA